MSLQLIIVNYPILEKESCLHMFYFQATLSPLRPRHHQTTLYCFQIDVISEVFFFGTHSSFLSVLV